MPYLNLERRLLFALPVPNRFAISNADVRAGEVESDAIGIMLRNDRGNLPVIMAAI